MEEEDIIPEEGTLTSNFLKKKYAPKRHSKAAKPGDLPTIEGFDVTMDTTKYDKGYSSYLNRGGDQKAALNRYRAARQSGWNQFGNSLIRLTNIIPEAVGSVASALDFEDYFNSDDEVGNWLTGLMEDWKEATIEATPIYRKSPGKALDFGDSGWWFENGSSLVNSIGGFAIGGGVITKGLVGLSKISKAGKLAQSILGANKAAKVGTVAHSVVTASMLNQAEAILEATSVYEDTYEFTLQKLKAEGTPNAEAKARQKAADAASITVSTNRVNILLNLSSANLFLKTPQLTRNILKKQTFKKSLSRGLVEGVQESAEEAINYVSSQRGLAFGEDKEYGYNELITDLKSPEALEAAMLGFVGGMGQTMVTTEGYQRIAKTTDPETGKRISLRQATKNQYDKQRNLIAEYDANAEATDVKSFTSQFESIADKIKIEKAYKNAIEKNDMEEAEKLANLSIDLQAYHAFRNGTTENLIKLYDELGQGEQKEGMGKDYKQKAKEATTRINSLEKIYNKTAKFENNKEVYINRVQDINLNDAYTKAISKAEQSRGEVNKHVDRLLKRFTTVESVDLDNLSELEKTKKNLFDKIVGLPAYEEFAGNTMMAEELDKAIDANNADYGNITSTKYQAKIKQDRIDARAKLEADMAELTKANDALTKIQNAKTDEELNAIPTEGKHAEKLKQAKAERKAILKKGVDEANAKQGQTQADTTEDTTTTEDAEDTEATEATEAILGNFNVGESVAISKELVKASKGQLTQDNIDNEDAIMIESDEDIHDDFVMFTVVGQGNKIRLPRSIIGELKSNPELEFNTDGSDNHDGLIPKNNENAGDSQPLGTGSPILSTTKQGTKKLDFVTDAWLAHEREPNDKTGVSVGFEVNTEVFKNKDWTKATKLHTKLAKGEKLTQKEIDHLIDHLPINATLAGESSPIHTKYKSNGNYDKFNSSSRELRLRIINAIIAGVPIHRINSVIEGQKQGQLQISPKIEGIVAENDITELHFFSKLSKTKVITEIKKRLGVVDNLGNFKYINGDTEVKFSPKPSAKGEVYIMIPMANGKPFPLKLNIKKIQKTDADLLASLYKLRLTEEVDKSTSLSDITDKALVKRIRTEFKTQLSLIGRGKDVTVKDIIEFMIWDRSKSKKSRVLFPEERKEGQFLFIYGNPKKNGKVVKKIEDFNEAHFSEWLQSEKRHNINIKQKKNTDTKATIATNNNYLKYLLENKVINTNAVIGENNPTFKGFTSMFINSTNVAANGKPVMPIVAKPAADVKVSANVDNYSIMEDGFDLKGAQVNSVNYILAVDSGRVFEEVVQDNQRKMGLATAVTDPNIVGLVVANAKPIVPLSETKYENIPSKIRISQKKDVPLQEVPNTLEKKQADAVDKANTKTDEVDVTDQFIISLITDLGSRGLLKIGGVEMNKIMALPTNQTKYEAIQKWASDSKQDISSIILKCKS